jgi:hypothetical protein
MSRYHLVTIWRVEGSIEEAADILADVERLPDWWPSVYLAFEDLAPGDENGIGREFTLLTKGWLPYTLRMRFRVAETDLPHRIVLRAEGDVAGRGEWTLTQDGPTAVLRYVWEVEARKPLFRALTWLLRPLFTANHDWAMRRGEESLRLELARRRARTPEERARIPPPPGRSALTFGVPAR